MISRTADATTNDSELCPECGCTTALADGAVPWCPRCEWNLNQHEPTRHRPEFGWRWIDRRTHALAYRLTRRQFADLAGHSLERPRTSGARAVTVIASVVLLAGVVTLALAGAGLVAYDFPAPTILPGVLLLGLAVALRPRFGLVDPLVEVLSRRRAPALFRLVEEVARAVGAPEPDIIAVEATFDAYSAAVGLRRHRVLCLGLPFWGVLAPQERVALLGHELGHFVNGDVRRGLLTQPAFTMLGAAADLVRPVTSVSAGHMSVLSWAAEQLARAVQWLLSHLLFGAHLLLVWVGQHDIQRAEYLADDLAARAAGSTAAVNLFDALLAIDPIAMVVGREARAGNGPARWRAAADEVRTVRSTRIPLLRQLNPPSVVARQLFGEAARVGTVPASSIAGRHTYSSDFLENMDDARVHRGVSNDVAGR